MNKSAIQKYAVWARNELIDQIKQRAFQYGISSEGYGDENAVSIHGRVLSDLEKNQRKSFIAEIKRISFSQAVESVAYIWFNRFIALRYMEVNDYLPTHIRVFSDAFGNFNPEILKEALHIDLPNLDKKRIIELLNEIKTDELYRYLLLTQCNALNDALPEMFERMGSYSEMLLPNNILKPEGVIGRLISDIPQDDFKDAVQIIGWLYQYYNTQPKQEVFDGLKKNIKITKEKIPAATQLFTPDWIVRYMVENSLGRIYIVNSGQWSVGSEEDRIKREKEIADKMGWKYYIPEAEQTAEVRQQLLATHHSSLTTNFNICDVKVLDPCMGSGHILVYAFDVLMQIYRAYGYSDRDATKLILEKNLYGLDIDRRAHQLAYFALMMKARQYNRRIFEDGAKPQVYHPEGDSEGMEYGSLLRVESDEWQVTSGERTLFDQDPEVATRIANFKRLLAQKYDVVVTNPPYMGASGMGSKLSQFVKDYYTDSKSDLFAVFMERGLEWIKPHGFNCMVTMQSWMFLSSFEKMRKKILQTKTITNLMHMENMVMGIAFGTAVANLQGTHIVGYKGNYNHIELSMIDNDVPKLFPPVGKRNVTTSADNFSKIPGNPIAYWASEKFCCNFSEGKPIGELSIARNGMKTGDNDQFVRIWWEVTCNSFCFTADSFQTATASEAKWFPYNKGGEYRKWYGNNDCVVNWQNAGSEVIGNARTEGRNVQDYPNEMKFTKSVSWSLVTSGNPAFRYKEKNISDIAGMSLYSAGENIFLLLGFCNSKIALEMLKILAPTINYQAGDIARLPIMRTTNRTTIDEVVKDNIFISRIDWDSFETSWDFKRHPLL